MMVRVVEAHVVEGKLVLVVARRGMMRNHLASIEKAVSEALGGARVQVLAETQWRDREANSA
jgi:hypothetical protein